MKQKVKKTLKKREINEWKIATGFLIVAIVLLTAMPFYENHIKEKEPISIKEHFCSITKKTPSWGSIQGEIIGTGYINFSAALNMSIDIVNKELIPNYLFFIYHPGCSACQAQIEYFGDTWQDYVDSGLTVNCEEYWK